MSYSNPYQVLGVNQGSTLDDIKSAYRKLVMLWHPDRNKSPNATDMFIRIQNAYETLSKARQSSSHTHTSPGPQQWSRQPQQQREPTGSRTPPRDPHRTYSQQQQSTTRDQKTGITGRVCSICGRFKSWSEFEHDKRRPEGRGPRCRQCLRERRRR